MRSLTDKNQQQNKTVNIRFFDWLQRITRPSMPFFAPERQQSLMLAWLLILLMVLIFISLIVVLIDNFSTLSLLLTYVGITLACLVALLTAFIFNFYGHYNVAARITMAAAILAPWVSMILDPTVLHGNSVPLVYVSVSIFLSSFLLSAKDTGIIAVGQLLALAAIPVFIPTSRVIDWASLLVYIVIISALATITNHMRQQIINQVSALTHNLLENEQELWQHSIRDPLTGVYNRRYMQEILDREFTLAFNHHTILSIIMADIDGSKKINDIHGHIAGDEILQKIVQFTSKLIRKTDIICRFGGDEFIIILPDTELSVANERARLIQEGIRDTQTSVDEKVTVSIGIASFPDCGPDAETIIDAADKALYKAKLLGKNQIVLADPESY